MNSHRVDIMLANPTKKNGFTLIEILIAMAIGSIVSAAIFVTYQSQQKSYVIQEDVAAMQQNLRAAMYLMEKEIRMAGFDPTNSKNFGITDIKLRDIDDDLDIAGNSSLDLTIDRDKDGALGAGDETVYYCIYDSPVASPDGKQDLARREGPRVGGGGRQLLAENIEALGLAYAFDDNGDGTLDFVDTDGDGLQDPGEIIWAIDSDNDNELDLNLDTNGDGAIDENDDTDESGLVDGVALASPVKTDRIRAVRIWLLAKSDRSDSSFNNTKKYVVGGNVINPKGNVTHYRRRLATTTITCRNLGL